MALQFTPNPRATGNLSLAANQRARMNSIVSMDWDHITGTILINPTQGGTGISNNTASTLTFSGAYATTFTLSGTTALTLPTTGTLATLAGSEALSNKTIGNTNTVTLKDTLFTLQDDGDTTKQAQFELSGIATATTRTYTLPDVSDTLVTLGATQELDNKTLDSSVGKGTWTASGTWTLPAFTLGGTVSGGGNQINNVIIGNSSPLAGSFTSLAYSTTLTGTSTNASALAIGRQGATDPVLKVNAATSSVATGVEITGAAAAAGVNVAAISSGTNENLTINAKGSGTITLGSTSTGSIVTTRTITANTFVGAAGSNLSFTADAAANVVFAVSGAATMVLGAGTLYSNPGGTNLGLAGGYEFGALRLSKFMAPPAPTTKTGNYSLAETDTSLIFNGSGTITLTLQAASSYRGRLLFVKTIAAQAVNSASSNVVPLAGGAAGTAILAATAGKWAILQSDATNWQIMASN